MPQEGLQMSEQQQQRLYPNHIRYFCKQQGYTLQALAEKINVPRRTLSDYVAGIRPIPRARLVKIARTLGCSVRELIPPPALIEQTDSAEAAESANSAKRVVRRKAQQETSLSQKPVLSCDPSSPDIVDSTATPTILLLLPSAMNHTVPQTTETALDQAGAWLAGKICQFGPLFHAGWSKGDILNALKILLPTVQTIQTLCDEQPGSIHQVGSSTLPSFDVHSLSEVERGHMTWTLGNGIAEAWKYFHRSSPYQSLTIAQALLTVLQQYHALILPSFRSLFYAGVYRLIGAALFFLERYQQAQQAQHAAYITALEGADLWSIAQSNIWQIYGYQTQKRYNDAMQLIINTLRIIEEQHDEIYQRIRAHLFALWGENATLQHQYNVASEKIHCSAQIARDIGWNEEFDQRAWLHMAGKCAFLAQNYRTAIDYFERVLEQLTPDDMMLQATVFTALATAYAQSGKQTASMAVIQKSLVTLRTFNAPVIYKQLYRCIEDDLRVASSDDLHIQALVREVQHLIAQSKSMPHPIDQ